MFFGLLSEIGNERANQKKAEYPENEVEVKLKIMFSLKLGLLLEKGCINIFGLDHLQRKTAISRIKNIRSNFHKSSKFPRNQMSYLFFPHGKTLRSRLTKHCSIK